MDQQAKVKKPIFKKWWFWLIIILVAIVIIGATRGGGNDEKTTTNSNNGETVTTNAVAANVAGQDGKGTLGKYDIEILTAEQGKDYEGKAILTVTYSWTNNSDKATSFSFAFSDKAYQGGIECQRSYVTNIMSDDNKDTADIKPGASIEVTRSYLLNDKSDVEVEVSELISFSDKVVSKTFTLE